jgi:RNA polymerase sigma factor (sigma-70 family)
MGQRLNGVVRRLRASVAQVEDTTDDAILLARFIEDQDGDAFATLVRRHGTMVLGVCRRVLRHAQDAEDAFQAVFLVLARKARSLRSRGLLANWLYGVAHRTALEARRAALTRQVKERRAAKMQEQATIDDDGTPDLRPLLDRELSLLPERYRTPVVLCDLEGLTRSEAARRLGWKEGTLAGRLFRARSLLAKRLSRHGLSVSGGALAAALAEASGARAADALVASTTQAALGVAGGQVAAASASALLLTEGVMKVMLLTKLKVMTAGLLVGCLVVGTGAAGYRALASEPGSEVAQAKRAEPTKGRPEADLEQLRRELEEARKEAAGQRDRAEALAREKELLHYDQRLSLVQRYSKAEDGRLRELLADRDQLLAEQAQLKSKLDGVEAKINELKTAIVLSASAPSGADQKGPIGMMPKASGPAGQMGGDDRAPREAGKLVLKTYQVDELVADAKGGFEVAKASDNLIALITQMVAPDTWSTRSGGGNIAYFQKTRTLFVVQSAEVQKQVADMLEQLRQLASQQQKAQEIRSSPPYPSGTGSSSPPYSPPGGGYSPPKP